MHTGVTRFATDYAIRIGELARETEGFSPADLRSLAQEAALAAMAREPDAETPAGTNDDFREALGRLRREEKVPVGFR